MKQISFFINVIAFMFATVTGVQAQVMKAADLEKYAKERYGSIGGDATAWYLGHDAEHRLAELPRLGGRHGVGIVSHASRKIYSSCKFIKKRGEERET